MGPSLLRVATLLIAIPFCRGKHTYPRLLLGTHHKTGTVLMKEMIDIWSRPEHLNLTVRLNAVERKIETGGHIPGSVHVIPFDPLHVPSMDKEEWDTIDVLFDHRVHWREEDLEDMWWKDKKHGSKRRSKFVHLIRHPLDIIASAYMYHKQDPPPEYEKWLMHPLNDLERSGKPWFLPVKNSVGKRYWSEAHDYNHLLQLLPLKLGAFIEGLRAKEDIEEMLSAMHVPGLQLCLEDFQQNFNSTVEKFLLYWLNPKKKKDKEIGNLQELVDAVQVLAHPKPSKHVMGFSEERDAVFHELAHHIWMQPLMDTFKLFAPEPCKSRWVPEWDPAKHVPYRHYDPLDPDPYHPDHPGGPPAPPMLTEGDEEKADELDSQDEVRSDSAGGATMKEDL